MKIAVVTTFPSTAWDIYGRSMLLSYVQFWPKEIPLLVQLDDDLLTKQVDKLIRPQDGLAVGWDKEHKEFVGRNKSKEDPQNYRKQPVRFCHKVFALKRAMDAIRKQKAVGGQDTPRYLIWMDADVITEKDVFLDDLKPCLPKEGDAVSYMGRKDWPHSECGWLAFDLDNGGDAFIDALAKVYITDEILSFEQTHDSWAFDVLRGRDGWKCTDLTPHAKGMEVWTQSPMGKWSTHYKGPAAKANLMRPKVGQAPANGKVIIQTRNAIPHEEIRAHIEKNQSLIKEWVRPCKKTNEEIIVASAGPMLIAEDLREEQKAGKKIVAVKHALLPLKQAGVKPWACILLDPRPHVTGFVNDADPNIIWFVASQVDPQVTMELLAKGCRVVGYHASVGAGEEHLINKQEYAIIGGGTATATRGLFFLKHLGFHRIKLYGYDLCIPDKPNLDQLDDMGQPKYLEMSVGINDPLVNLKRCFWSEPQLVAQFEELNDLIKQKTFELSAVGDGIVPFLLKCQRVSNLRREELKAKIVGSNPPTYKELLYGHESVGASLCPKSSANTKRARRTAGAGRRGTKSAGRARSRELQSSLQT